MKKFLQKSSVYILIMSGMILLSFLILIYSENKVLLEDQKIIIAGDSNTECAINDQISKQILNISKSGESYFYTYQKLKHLLEFNDHIEKIYLSFSPHNVITKGERLFDNGRVYNNFIEYAPVLDLNSMFYLFKEDKKNVILSFFKSPIYVVQHHLSKNLWGGHLKLQRNNLESKIKNINELPKIFSLNDIDKIEIKYLKKIVSLLDNNNVKLILINTPKRIELINHSNSFELHKKIYEKEFLDVKFLDFSSMYGEKEYFGDFVHLNKLGSKEFTSFFVSKIIDENIK